MENYKYQGRVFFLRCKISVSFLSHIYTLLNVYFYRQRLKIVMYTSKVWGFFVCVVGDAGVI